MAARTSPRRPRRLWPPRRPPRPPGRRRRGRILGRSRDRSHRVRIRGRGPGRNRVRTVRHARRRYPGRSRGTRGGPACAVREGRGGPGVRNRSPKAPAHLRTACPHGARLLQKMGCSLVDLVSGKVTPDALPILQRYIGSYRYARLNSGWRSVVAVCGLRQRGRTYLMSQENVDVKGRPDQDRGTCRPVGRQPQRPPSATVAELGTCPAYRGWRGHHDGGRLGRGDEHGGLQR